MPSLETDQGNTHCTNTHTQTYQATALKCIPLNRTSAERNTLFSHSCTKFSRARARTVIMNWPHMWRTRAMHVSSELLCGISLMKQTSVHYSMHSVLCILRAKKGDRVQRRPNATTICNEEQCDEASWTKMTIIIKSVLHFTSRCQHVRIQHPHIQWRRNIAFILLLFPFCRTIEFTTSYATVHFQHRRMQIENTKFWTMTQSSFGLLRLISQSWIG